MTTTTTTQQIVEMYGAAWGETDAAKRTQLLQQSWADGATYTDPQSHAEGRDALDALIAGFQSQVQGARIVATSAVDQHHELFRFTWAMRAADGSTMIEGIDFGELAPDGRIQRIVGFFGPPPAAP